MRRSLSRFPTRIGRSCASFARVLAAPEVQAVLSAQPPTSSPATHLPLGVLPPEIENKLDTWTAAALDTANAAAQGQQAYSLSVPMLIASQRGLVQDAAPLAARMCLALEQESADHQVDKPMRAWLLGRLLLASNQMGDSTGAAAFENQLNMVLEELQEARGPDSHAPPMEAWGCAYLLMHSCGGTRYELEEWLPRLKEVWGAAEGAAGLAIDPTKHGDRMWVNTLAVSSIAMGPHSATVKSIPDPLLEASMAELLEDVRALFCIEPKAVEVELLNLTTAQQMPLAQATRLIPQGDFRCWAAGMMRLAAAHAQDAQFELEAEEAFFESLCEADKPGDMALGATNYLLAKHVSAN